MQRLRAKRGPGKDECQRCLQCPSQIPPSFPSSSLSILSLLPLSSSWLVFTPAEKDPLWWSRLWLQCVFRLRTVSLNSLCIHTRCLLCFSHIIICVLPFLPFLPSIFSSLQLFTLPFPYPCCLFFICSLYFISATTPSNSSHSLSLSVQLSLLSLSTFFGPSFQSNFNWLGLESCSDDRRSPPGEVNMYRYGAPSHCHRINTGWLQGMRSEGLFNEGFLLDIYLSPAAEMRPYTQCLKYPTTLRQFKPLLALILHQKARMCHFWRIDLIYFTSLISADLALGSHHKTLERTFDGRPWTWLSFWN